MSTTATTLTVIEQVEQSKAVQLLDARASALLELLPDASAATRFRRIVLQALAKNPELLECTPESVVLSVFEAATQGLEPTGAAGGAHLVPFNVKVQRNPDRWEKRAQLIPDYRGVIRLVTNPQKDNKGRVIAPSEIASLEARVVKEGDEFSYQLGTEADVHHVPALTPDRSAKATTHVYAIAHLRNGERIPDVMDRAEVERIRTKKKEQAFSPWATDWDEMAKKTVIKRISKNLPVRPEIRSILVREDELPAEAAALEAPAPTAGGSKVSRLAARLAAPSTSAELNAELDPDIDPRAPGAALPVEEGSFVEAPAAASAAVPPAEEEGEPDFAMSIRELAASTEGEGRAAKADVEALLAGAFKNWNLVLVQDGVRLLFGADAVSRPTSAQVHALRVAADSMTPVAWLAAWRAMLAEAEGGAS